MSSENILTGAPAEWDNGAHMTREIILDHNVVMALEVMDDGDVTKMQEIIKPYMRGAAKGKGKRGGKAK